MESATAKHGVLGKNALKESPTKKKLSSKKYRSTAPTVEIIDLDNLEEVSLLKMEAGMEKSTSPIERAEYIKKWPCEGSHFPLCSTKIKRYNFRKNGWPEESGWKAKS